MRLAFIISLACFIVAADRAESQPVRGAFPSPSVQILPMMVAQEKGFYKREGLDLELVFVGGASTAVQALIANQIHFIFSVGPQMPAVWEGADIMLLAQQVGRPTFSLVVTPDIQRIADLKGRKIGVTFGGSTAAGTKALLDLNKINPDKDVEYIGLPGNEPKIAAMKQGIISAALLAPPGVLIGKYNSAATKNEVMAALHKAGKCCDDPNCKHNHGTSTQRPANSRSK